MTDIILYTHAVLQACTPTGSKIFVHCQTLFMDGRHKFVWHALRTNNGWVCPQQCPKPSGNWFSCYTVFKLCKLKYINALDCFLMKIIAACAYTVNQISYRVVTQVSYMGGLLWCSFSIQTSFMSSLHSTALQAWYYRLRQPGKLFPYCFLLFSSLWMPIFSGSQIVLKNQAVTHWFQICKTFCGRLVGLKVIQVTAPTAWILFQYGQQVNNLCF